MNGFEICSMTVGPRKDITTTIFTGHKGWHNNMYPSTEYEELLTLCFKSMATGPCGLDIQLVNFQVISMIESFGIYYDIDLRWISEDFTDEKSILH